MKKVLLAAMVVVGLAGCANLGGGSGAPQRAAAPVDDAAIGNKMKAALAADPELSALKITVDSTQGAVRLRGEIKSMVLRRKVEDLARKIEGVRSVDNQLIITG